MVPSADAGAASLVVVPAPAGRDAEPAPVRDDDEDELAEPSPLALPCDDDAQCATHRCNLRHGKCAFPCRSDADCVPGAVCFMASPSVAVCVPSAPAGP